MTWQRYRFSLRAREFVESWAGDAVLLAICVAVYVGALVYALWPGATP